MHRPGAATTVHALASGAPRAPRSRGTEETSPKNSTNHAKGIDVDAPQRRRPAAPFYLSGFDNGLMDDIVRQAIAKWPNVPHCWGWLGLDARGNWYMRDDRTQASGDFPKAKGSLLRHEKLVDFIQRNYEHDERGQWLFQNGPQRVYVELESTPLVFRIGADGGVEAHTGRSAAVK